MTPERFNAIWPNVELTQGQDGYWEAELSTGGQVTGFSPEVVHLRLCSSLDLLLDLDNASVLESSVARIREAAKGATRENFRSAHLQGLDVQVSISADGVPSVDVNTEGMGDDAHTTKGYIPRIRVVLNEGDLHTPEMADDAETHTVPKYLPLPEFRR